MNTAGRLAALEQLANEAGGTQGRCPDPFHRRVDYRESIRLLCPPSEDLPALPHCPTCDGERLAGLPVAIVAVEYVDAVAGIVRAPEVRTE